MSAGQVLSDGLDDGGGYSVESDVPAAGSGFEDGHGGVVAAPVLRHENPCRDVNTLRTTKQLPSLIHVVATAL